MNLPFARFVKKVSEVDGVFSLFDQRGAELKVRARSGQADCQDRFWERSRSPIPPSDKIRGSYEICLPGYPPDDTSAMGSIFYPVIPDPIEQKDGAGVRSEIGIHYDANFNSAPGSAGCIVISPRTGDEPGMSALKSKFSELYAAGYSRIPLEVVYEGAGAGKAAEPASKKKHIFEDDYNAMIKEGIFKGRADEDLDAPLTRGEAAALLHRVVDRLNKILDLVELKEIPFEVEFPCTISGDEIEIFGNKVSVKFKISGDMVVKNNPL